MSVSELQTDITKQLLSIEDIGVLEIFKEMLSNNSENAVYKLTEQESRLISESMADYQAGNTMDGETVFQRNKKWLEE